MPSAASRSAVRRRPPRRPSPSARDAGQHGEVLGDALPVAELAGEGQALLGQRRGAVAIAVGEQHGGQGVGDGGDHSLCRPARRASGSASL